MLYLIQTIFYATIFYLVYLLLLRNKLLHRFNRFYLLICAILPMILPLVKLGFLSGEESIINLYRVRVPEIIITDSSSKNEAWNYHTILIVAYAFISLTLLCKAIIRWRKLHEVIINAEKIITADYTLLINTGYGPGSYGKYIFLPESTADQRIITHEAAHIQLKHTWDYVFLTILQCLCWYNPILTLIKKEIQQVHEFEADSAIQTEKTGYQQLLLNQFLSKCQLPFTQSFINHPIKRRIMMLNKKDNRPTNALRIVCAIAAAAFLVSNIIWIQSCKSKKWELSNNNEVASGNTSPEKGVLMTGEKTDTKYDRIAFDQMGSISSKLYAQISYPEFAKNNNIQGRVLLKFMIDKTGHVRNATIQKTDHRELSDAALEALYKASPYELPLDNYGKKHDIWFILPVTFKLEKEKNKVQAITLKKIEAPGVQV